jgi:hypothetical protein
MVEEGQLSEIYYERENEYTLAGSIYKGRVTRVLPGMQSAFVDIGLERDAFLYVSDFFELEGDEEEFDSVPVIQQARESQRTQRHRQGQPSLAQPPEGPSGEEAAETENEPFILEGGAGEEPAREAQPAAEPRERESRSWGRRRRRGRRGRGFPESKFAHPAERAESEPRALESERTPPARPATPPPSPAESGTGRAPWPGYQPIVLPGESISKYQRLGKAPVVPEQEPAKDLETSFPSQAGPQAPSEDLSTRAHGEETEEKNTDNKSRAGWGFRSPLPEAPPSDQKHVEQNEASVFGAGLRVRGAETEAVPGAGQPEGSRGGNMRRSRRDARGNLRRPSRMKRPDRVRQHNPDNRTGR